MPNAKNSTTLRVLAKDSQGRKFTNCTALEVDYKSSGEGALIKESISDWELLNQFTIASLSKL